MTAEPECFRHWAPIDAFFPILRRPVTLEKAMDKKNAARNMMDTAEQVFRLIGLNTGADMLARFSTRKSSVPVHYGLPGFLSVAQQGNAYG